MQPLCNSVCRMDPQDRRRCDLGISGLHTDTERPDRFASLSMAMRTPRLNSNVSSARRPMPSRRAPHPGPQFQVAGRSRLPPGNLESILQNASTGDEVCHIPQFKEQSRGLAGKVWSTVGALVGVLFGAARTGAATQSALQFEGRIFPSMLPGRLPGDKERGPSTAGTRKAAIVWFRNDLRLHDHEALAAACKGSASVLPVYCFDPREHARNHHGQHVVSPDQARVLLDSIAELRTQLRKLGSELVLRVGRPEDVLPDLVKLLDAGSVYCHPGVLIEERKVIGAVHAAVRARGAGLHVMWGGSLLHPDDLPCVLEELPQNFVEFNKKLSGVAAREPLAAPQQLPGVPLGSVEAGELPTMHQLGYGLDVLSKSAELAPDVASIRGGEAQALHDLQVLIQQASSSEDPAEKLVGAYGHITSWLTCGCISNRRMVHELQKLVEAAQRIQQGGKAGELQGAMASYTWVAEKLMRRDYFMFLNRKYALIMTAKNRRKALASRGRSLPPTAQTVPVLGMAPA